MASYKVPQDVEAEDKLLGPFTFRQFIYLMVVLGGIVLAVTLFQIFPLLAVIPLPFVFFFLILALPIKKDQPMETYLAALLSFYLKPRRRFWMPGQSESTILITAPKKVEVSRTRNITSEEAGHRLSFLANIIDTEGYAIKSANNPLRDEFYAEASSANDMFDRPDSARIRNLIYKEQQSRHNEIVHQMREAIAASKEEHRLGEQNTLNQHVIQPRAGFSEEIKAQDPTNPAQPPLTPIPPINSVSDPLSSSVVIQPDLTSTEYRKLDELAQDPNLSVATIQKEADRIRKENDSEIYVSLH